MKKRVLAILMFASCVCFFSSCNKAEDDLVQVETTQVTTPGEYHDFMHSLDSLNALYLSNASMTRGNSLVQYGAGHITEKLAEEARLKETEEAIAVLSSSIESLQKSRARAEEDLRKMRAKSEEAKARGKAAKAKMKADGQMARCSAHYSKFEDIEKRMAKWEIYTEKENSGIGSSFEEIERDAEIERELNKLKDRKMEA